MKTVVTEVAMSFKNVHGLRVLWNDRCLYSVLVFGFGCGIAADFTFYTFFFLIFALLRVIEPPHNQTVKNWVKTFSGFSQTILNMPGDLLIADSLNQS